MSDSRVNSKDSLLPSRINSTDELLPHSESSTSIDINLDNDILLDEIDSKAEVINDVDTLGEEEGEISTSFIENLNSYGETLMTSVYTRKQTKEFKETIITDSTSSFAFGFKNIEKIFPETLDLTPTNPIPDWLNITLFTLNPARFDFDYTQQKELESVNKTFSIEHLFDVLPVIQKFNIDGKNDPEKVIFMSQLLCRGVERKIHENHCISDKVTGLWSRNTNQSSFSRTLIHPLKLNKKAINPENDLIADNINCQFPSKYHQGAVATLNSIGNVRLINSELKGERVINYMELNQEFKTSYCSPHPILDPYTGKTVNILGEIGLTSTKFKVVQFDENTSSVITVINAPVTPIHTFALTENYIIIISFPYILKKRGLNYFTGDSVLSSYDFDPNGETTFYVVSKKENKHIATFNGNACYGLHSINAYETNQTIWVDFSTYENDIIIQNLTTDNIRNGTKLPIPSSKIIRFRLDLNEQKSDVVDKNQIPIIKASFAYLSQDISIELPTINQKYIGHNYKYAYGIALPFTDPTPGKYYDRIKKIDLESQQYIIWNEPHCYPSQPLFVQNPSKIGEEDEGVLLSCIYDGSKDESFILILNAKDLTEISRIPLPVPVAPSLTHAAVRIN